MCFSYPPSEVVPWLPAGTVVHRWEFGHESRQWWSPDGARVLLHPTSLQYLPYCIRNTRLDLENSVAQLWSGWKKHLCGGCDRLVILYLQIANYSSDWLLSDQFACAVMVTGLQIRGRISRGCDVAFWSCMLGSKTHGQGILCNQLPLAALYFCTFKAFSHSKETRWLTFIVVFFFF